MKLAKVILFVVSFLLFMHWAAGTRAFKYTFGGLWYMLTRPAMVVAWVIGTAGLAYLLWTSAASEGRDPSETLGMLAGLAVFCGAGFAALVVPPVWMLSCLRRPHPQLELDDGETALLALKANHVAGRESRGGQATLTDRAVRFVPGRMNLQTHSWVLPLSDVARLEVAGGRLLLLHDRAGDEHAIILQDPASFRDAILARLPPVEGCAVTRSNS